MAEADLPIDEGRRPSVIVSHLDITYRVFGASKPAAEGDDEASALTRLVRSSKEVGAVHRVHAVKDVSFVAYHGESIGIIGTNGSGKSTLLRAIAGLMPPAAGRVWVSGEPALLGVNAVLMPKMTGERNIYIGAQAMGLSRGQIERRFDDIVEFSGIGDAVYRPMSTYSSGQAARLRFAISTATAPDILMVDEALSTGDAAFRAKSSRRIRQIREEASTVFLVSHSNATVRQICDRVLWLEQGELLMDGPTDEVLSAYKERTDALAAGTSRERRIVQDKDVPGVERWGGKDRFAASAKASRERFPHRSAGVVLVSDNRPVLAAAALPLAWERGWPVLVTQRQLVPESTLSEISRLMPKEILIVGDESVISAETVDQLTGFGFDTITRVLDDEDGTAPVRVPTDARSAERLDVVSESQVRRLLPAVIASWRDDVPLLVLRPNVLDEASTDYLRTVAPLVVTQLGAPGALPKDTAAQLASVAAQTDAEMVTRDWRSPAAAYAALCADDQGPADTVYVVPSGEGGETIAGVAAAVPDQAPVLVVQRDVIPKETEQALHRLRPGRIVLIGGPSVISPAVRVKLAGFLST